MGEMFQMIRKVIFWCIAFSFAVFIFGQFIIAVPEAWAFGLLMIVTTPLWLRFFAMFSTCNNKDDDWVYYDSKGDGSGM